MTDEAKEAGALERGVRAVVYGLPLVLMDLTMKQATNVARPTHGFAAPPNQFANAGTFPTAEFKTVVRANVDTLYSSAFLDVTKEPVVLSVPDTDGRYYLMPILDAWTDVLASPGKRTTGTQAANFAITGPGWNGKLPPGVSRIASPTGIVWILGRTQTNGPDDYPAVPFKTDFGSFHSRNSEPRTRRPRALRTLPSTCARHRYGNSKR